ncbi:uncharacterized protein BO72DRAFT_454386 [Aspergillus fijiensis CBS 313.89]|uniref:Uncharacterized protein n=1 Tax=Aspergillus fijiensis CBS 313.89 TaxID=1448319 RepID=A0A8G1S526_9EURO|nr:uncharacterized protein BO72DRAFT_454386 [Aspergillus fijiensis CBS 313.89]RAK82671.1 hypothetical protein BO72DRAFT_454386 [Aspergillus fijiensis CBS 313.89]
MTRVIFSTVLTSSGTISGRATFDYFYYVTGPERSVWPQQQQKSSIRTTSNSLKTTKNSILLWHSALFALSFFALQAYHTWSASPIIDTQLKDDPVVQQGPYLAGRPVIQWISGENFSDEGSSGRSVSVRPRPTCCTLRAGILAGPFAVYQPVCFRDLATAASDQSMRHHSLLAVTMPALLATYPAKRFRTYHSATCSTLPVTWSRVGLFNPTGKLVWFITSSQSSS